MILSRVILSVSEESLSARLLYRSEILRLHLRMTCAYRTNPSNPATCAADLTPCTVCRPVAAGDTSSASFLGTFLKGKAVKPSRR